MKAEYVLPEINENAFNCPNCHVYSKQHWYYLRAAEDEKGFGSQFSDRRFKVSNCENCGFPTIWLGPKIIYPNNSSAEPPNIDLPKDIKDDYEEARHIANDSPRGAAALLRLAIQKICIYLGQPGEKINDDIKALVANGLPSKVQEALDSVRVIGNNAVHPGYIDLKDDRITVAKLFRLVNFIAQKTITEPKEIEDIYNTLPPPILDGISKRDGKKTNQISKN